MEGVGRMERDKWALCTPPHQELVRIEQPYVAGIWKPRQDLCIQKALLLSRHLRPLAPLWSTVALSP